MEMEKIDSAVGYFTSQLKRGGFPIDPSSGQPGEPSLEQQLRSYLLVSQEQEPYADLRDEIDGDSPTKYPVVFNYKLRNDQEKPIEISIHCEIQSYDVSIRTITIKTETTMIHTTIEKENVLPEWKKLLEQVRNTNSPILPVKNKTIRQLTHPPASKNKLK